MGEQPVVVIGFLDAIKAWVETVEHQKPEHADVETAKLKIFGQLLADDQEFQNLFQFHLDGCSHDNPEKAMHCVYAFFNAVADTTRPGKFRSHSPPPTK